MTDLLHVYTHVCDEGHWYDKRGAMLDYFLRHYLTLAERVTVCIDTQSADDTRDICRSYGPQVAMADWETGGMDDSAFVTRASRTLTQDDALYAMWPDCDEFLKSRGNLREELQAHTLRGARVLQAGRGYQMFAENFPTTPGPIWDEVGRGVREDTFCKPIVISPATRVFWQPGKHELVKPHAPIVVEPLWDYCHFRCLGEDYHIARNARNWARVPEAERAKGHGWQTGPQWEQVTRENFRRDLARAEVVE